MSEEDSRSGVEPTPVSVEDNAAFDGRASAASLAGLPGESRVDLRSLRANLLGTHDCEQSESEEGCRREHCALQETDEPNRREVNLA